MSTFRAISEIVLKFSSSSTLPCLELGRPINRKTLDQFWGWDWNKDRGWGRSLCATSQQSPDPRPEPLPFLGVEEHHHPDHCEESKYNNPSPVVRPSCWSIIHFFSVPQAENTKIQHVKYVGPAYLLFSTESGRRSRWENPLRLFPDDELLHMVGGQQNMGRKWRKENCGMVALGVVGAWGSVSEAEGCEILIGILLRHIN